MILYKPAAVYGQLCYVVGHNDVMTIHVHGWNPLTWSYCYVSQNVLLWIDFLGQQLINFTVCPVSESMCMS